MPVRFGLLHLFESPSGRTEQQYYRENIELIDYAEAVGLDEVWLAEHHFSDYGVMPSTQVFGSYIAARTERIRIGTGVVVLPFHNPIRVAEEFAFLDVLSNGRLDFGVGRGYQPQEFAGYGMRLEDSRGLFDESLEIIRRAWTEPSVTYHGTHFQFENVRPRPRPLQQPHPPLFGASFNADTIKYQAMKQLNLIFTPLSARPEHIAEYRRILREAGEDPAAFRIAGLVFVYVCDDREQAYCEFEQPCMWYYRTLTSLIPAGRYPTEEEYYRSLHGTLTAMLHAYDSGEITFGQIAEEGPFSHAFLVGDPVTVTAKLATLLDMYEGMTDLLCWTRLGGLDHGMVMRSMEQFVTHVTNPLKASSPA